MGQPFSAEAPVISAQFKLGDPGTVTIQLTDDVVKSTTAGATSRAEFNKSSQQPASTLEYQGQFAWIAPLLQIGSYDINHSKYYVVGLKADANNVHSTLDYVVDNKSVQLSADEKDTTVITSASWNIDYTVRQVVQPFLKLVSYNVKDAKVDIKGNSAFNPAKTTAPTYEPSAISDNATLYTVGAWAIPMGDTFRPYLAFTSKTAKFLKIDGSDETESKTENHIRIGVAGEF